MTPSLSFPQSRIKEGKKKSRKKSNVHMSGKEVANVEKDALEGDGKFAKTFAKF